MPSLQTIDDALSVLEYLANGAMCGSLIAQARACETCYLAVLESDRAIVVDKLDSQLPVIATAILGRALPLHGVSAGKVLLASRPDHEVDALIARSIAAYPEAKPSDPVRIWNEVRRTRTQGYAVCMPAVRYRASGAEMR